MDLESASSDLAPMGLKEDQHALFGNLPESNHHADAAMTQTLP